MEHDDDEDIYAVVRVPMWRRVLIAAILVIGIGVIALLIFGPDEAKKRSEQKALESIEITVPTE